MEYCNRRSNPEGRTLARTLNRRRSDSPSLGTITTTRPPAQARTRTDGTHPTPDAPTHRLLVDAGPMPRHSTRGDGLFASATTSMRFEFCVERSRPTTVARSVQIHQPHSHCKRSPSIVAFANMRSCVELIVVAPCSTNENCGVLQLDFGHAFHPKMHTFPQNSTWFPHDFFLIFIRSDKIL